SDFTVMTEQASIFTAGPPVVKQSIGEDVDKLELGGPSVALASGLVDHVAADEPGAVEQARRDPSFFPPRAGSSPGWLETGDTGARAVPELLSIVPRNGRRVYDMRQVIDAVVDGGDWFEVQPRFGATVICGLARLGGHAVAIVANQPKVMAGSVDADGAD